MKRLVTLVFVVVAALAVTAAPAGAGGWAVSSADPIPAIEPGRPATIGFVIRQHGVTPIDMDDVAVVVRAADGRIDRFPARSDGRGHYTAEVTLPAGRHTWQVDQGMFGPQDMGELVVGAAPAAVPAPPSTATRPASNAETAQTVQTAQTTETTRQWPAVVRWGLLAVTAAALVTFVWAVWPRRGPKDHQDHAAAPA